LRGAYRASQSTKVHKNPHDFAPFLADFRGFLPKAAVFSQDSRERTVSLAADIPI
jgi:hypothetical protein